MERWSFAISAPCFPNRSVTRESKMIDVLKRNMLQARQELDSATVVLQRRVDAELERAR